MRKPAKVATREEAMRGLSDAERERLLRTLQTIKGNLVREEISRASPVLAPAKAAERPSAEVLGARRRGDPAPHPSG